MNAKDIHTVKFSVVQS